MTLNMPKNREITANERFSAVFTYSLDIDV